jgi:antiviral helicase SLH1
MARWPTDNPLSIFPGVDPTSNASMGLVELGSLSPENSKTLTQTISIPSTALSSFLKAVSMLPNLEVSVADVTALTLTVNISRKNRVANKECRIYAPRFPKSQTEGWFVVVADSARDEVIAVKRVGWSAGPGKSVSIGSRPSARAIIKLPELEGAPSGSGERERKLDVLVISDGYLGLSYEIKGVEIPAPPLVVDTGKK